MLKVFVDSCIFIQSFKKPSTEQALNLMHLILECYRENRIVPFINLVVENEVIYILFFKKKSAFDLKGFLQFLDGFQFLDINLEIRNLYRKFVFKYGLLPNDALILATCKHYGLHCLASTDADFQNPCEREGIVLLSSAEELEKELNR
jgi:predicted nucleic acid-binding protein